MANRKYPNILWIQTDEQRPDSLGCYGSEWAKTPNIDRLAQQGVTFHECHVQSPVCVPCRTSMITGRYPQELGIYENTCQFKDGFLDPELKTFPELFAAAGYQTASFGKWHTPNHPTWQTNVLFDLFPKASDYYRLPEPYSEDEHRVIKRLGATPIIMGGIYPHHDWGVTPSSHVTDMGIRFLKDAAKNDQPFLLRVSHVWPHTPVLVPRPWDNAYAKDEVPCRAARRQDYENRSEFDRWFADLQKGMDIPLDTWRQVCADYYALCVYVDHEVGRLLSVLDELGLAENTIIAFNSDHGKSLGEAGLCEKGTYDREVWRVPFILSWPGHLPSGENRHDLMELMDFGSTLLAMAGLNLVPGMHGRDLFNSAEPETVHGIIDIGPYRRAGVRTTRYRFDCTVLQNGKPVGVNECDANLFDIENDPHEERNLARNSAKSDLVKWFYHEVNGWIKDFGKTS